MIRIYFYVTKALYSLMPISETNQHPLRFFLCTILCTVPRDGLAGSKYTAARTEHDVDLRQIKI